MEYGYIVRPATEEDGPAIAALAALAGGLGTWGAQQRVGPDRPDQVRYVETDGDTIAAYGCVWRRRQSTFGLDTLVHPAHRGRGLGRLLVDKLFEELAARNAVAVESRVDVDHADALNFLLRRGFFELNRVERVRLDLAGAELAEDHPEGVTITTLAAARDAETERAIHALVTAAFRERPIKLLEPFVETPIDEFVVELDKALAGGCFIATAGGERVGFSGLIPGPEPGSVREFMTAVRPDHRGRGLATALIQRAIAFAKQSGYRAVYSTSPTRAMQAVNERLGFVRYAPTEIRMGRRLRPG
jgi:mycothiol synthase